MVASRKSQVASRKSQVASRKSQVASRKSQVASSKLISFFALLIPLFLFLTSPIFAASSSLDASTLEEIHIDHSHPDDVAATCRDIAASKDMIPHLCADFIDYALELAINSDTVDQLNQEPKTYGQSDYEKLAYAINQEAKENYLLSQEEVEAAKDAASSLGFNPNEVVYVSASTTDGLSVRHKGVEIASSNYEKPNKRKGFWATLVLAAAVVVAAEMIGGSHSSSHSEDESPEADPPTTCKENPTHWICSL